MLKIKLFLLSVCAFVAFAAVSAVAQDFNAPLTADDLIVAKKNFALNFKSMQTGAQPAAEDLNKFLADNNVSSERLTVIQTRVSAVLAGAEAQLPDGLKPSEADVALINGDKDALMAAMTTGEVK
ncbi:MAG: hypothetical protein LBU12_01940 [Deltaproteobacteria bacterium]|jgi:hypothetical protein|nr:hypothetical protein [Deltaproteobacteria bacterium]